MSDRASIRFSYLVILGLASACASGAPSAASGPHASPEAMLALLRGAQFSEAAAEAERVLANDPAHPTASAVWALARYREALHNMYADGVTLAAGVMAGAFLGGGGLNQRLLDFALNDAQRRLEAVDRALAVAQRDPNFALELCLACWQVDWNRNGELDDNDQRLLEVELDAQGEPYPDGDPRRRPTFRFDVADILWLRAFVTFELAAIELAQAYELELGSEFLRRGQGAIRLRLRDAARVKQTRVLLLAGLDLADETRQAVLAETDDNREWLPNPRQKDHPMPLPVDAALFETWEGIIADLRGLIAGKQGLSVTEVAQLGDHQWKKPPKGYIDIGAMFDDPKDIVLEPERLDRYRWQDDELTREMEHDLGDIFGAAYSPQMSGSALPKRLMRMKGEMERGEDMFEHKLRYLLWLN